VTSAEVEVGRVENAAVTRDVSAAVDGHVISSVHAVHFRYTEFVRSTRTVGARVFRHTHTHTASSTSQ